MRLLQLHKLFSVLLIVLGTSTVTSINAQERTIEVKGLIIDQEKYPIPYVAVGIVKKHIGTSSTEDGEFSFLISKNELQDSLSISSLGFSPYKIRIEDYLKLEKKEIILEETTTELNEVNLLNASDYVQNALKSLKANTMSQPHKIELLFRRAATEGGKSKFLVENYIKTRNRGPAYAIGAIQVAESRKSADYRIWKSKQWRHSVLSMFDLNPLRQHQSQHKRNLKKFIWKKDGESSYEGEDVLIIKGYNPKKETEKIVFYIGVDSYKVYRIERGKTLFVFKKHENGKLFMSYFKNEWSFPKSMIPEEYLNTDAETLHYKTEAFVYNVETDKKNMRVIPFGEDTDMAELDLPYNPTFWNSLSMPPDTGFYKKIKSELESNYGVSLEEQYKIVNKQ